MLWPKRNSNKEVDNEKNSCGLKIRPISPIMALGCEKDHVTSSYSIHRLHHHAALVSLSLPVYRSETLFKSPRL